MQTPQSAAIDSAWQRNACMVILFLVMALNVGDRLVFSIIIEPIKKEFGLSDTMLGLLTGPAFAILYAILSIPVARLADVGNRRTIIVAAIAAWSAMTALCGMAHSLIQLFLFRIGVGIGEVGATPPSHSLIARYYPPERRAAAFAFINMGATAGNVLVFGAGGWIAATYGWRKLLIAMGAPGLLVALFAYFILVEDRPKAPFPSITKVFVESWGATKVLLKKPAYRYLLIAFTLYGFVSIGGLMWDIAFFRRTFDVPLPRVSAVMGFMSLITGTVGLMGGGFLGNYFGKKDIQWLARLPAITIAASFPFMLAKYLVPDFWMAATLMTVGSLILVAFVGPFYAAVQAVSGEANRGMAIALLIFSMNIVGMGLGPFVTGFMSDMFVQFVGAQSLRYTLAILVFLLPLAAFHCWRATLHMRDDMPA